MNEVTIIIKTFERPESLEKLLVSIRRFYPLISIIVADDSKTPSTQNFVNRFSSLEYIPLPFDVGLSAGRNELMARVKTKYFVLCDDDFVFDEKTQLINFKKILDETDVELVGGYFHDITETGEFSKTHLYAGGLVMDSARNLRLVVLTPAQPFVRCEIVPNFFMADTQAVIRKTGGWDPQLKVEEHTDFFWRAKQAGLKVAFTPDVSVNHTVARHDDYLVFRYDRMNKYHRLFFNKFKIRSFTDTWETITWQQIQPWFIIVLRWRHFLKIWRPRFQRVQDRLQRFVFDQKCIPWFVIERWRSVKKNGKNKMIELRSWLPNFIFKQKCMPWFVIQYWKDLRWNSTVRVKKTLDKLNNKGLILMYHRVTKLEHDPWQLCVDPERFDEHMQVLKKYGRPVPMREIGKDLKGFSFGDKQIVVTFDDGYADNFLNAKPILEKHGIPATFFIVSGVIDSAQEYWWDELERIIFTSLVLPSVFELTIAGKEYCFSIVPGSSNEAQSYTWEKDIPSNNTTLTKDQLYFILWRILSRLSIEEKKVALRQIAQWSGKSSATRDSHRIMTSKELLDLAGSPLVEIGAHTAFHPMLSNLALSEQENEVSRSKRDLEEKLGQKITSFSYPHGAYSDETAKIVENQKFHAACTTQEQPVLKDMNPYLLPRFAVFNWDGNQFEQHLQKWLAYE